MSLFIAWLGVMFPLVFSPGPANIVFAASGARVGLRRSLPLLVGIDLVFIIKSIVVGYGLIEVVHAYPWVMHTMQLLGALYLLYLAWQFVRAKSGSATASERTLGLVDGLIIQTLNSKGWLMVVLMFTLFTEASTRTFGEHGIGVLVLWLALLNISMHLVWVGIGDALSRLSDRPGYDRAMNSVYAVSLVAVALWMLLDHPWLKLPA
ncbi:LysE family translocator [Chitinibacteraceae bacterium HSL-7]